MTEVLKELEDWLRQRPKWLQEAAILVLEKGTPDENDVKHLAELCKLEATKADSMGLRTIPIGMMWRDRPKQQIHLDRISNVSGVNRLSPRKPLEFGEAPLSIVFGRNGSGKSGYVRLLKHICGSRAAGALLGNVFASTDEGKSCEVSFSYTTTGAKTIRWVLDQGPQEELSCVKLYDTECASLYVNSENEVTYEPWPLPLLTELSEVCTRVAQLIDNETNSIKSSLPSLPVEYKDTEHGAWYLSINPDVSEEEIEKRSSWDSDSKAKLEEIQKRIAERNPAEQAMILQKALNNGQGFLADIKQAMNGISDELCAEYIKAKRDLEIKQRTANEDARKVFSNALLDGVGSEVWKLLWKHAREYSEQHAYEGWSFPHIEEGARCVLCQQPLDKDAKGRLVSFEEFVTGRLEKEVSQALQTLDLLEKGLGDVPTQDQVDSKLDSMHVYDEPLRSEIQAMCLKLEQRREQLRLVNDIAEIEPLPQNDLLSQVVNHLASIQQQAAAFEEDSKKDNWDDLKRAIKELEAQRWISQQSESIRAEMSRQMLVRRLNSARRLTNTSTLSTKKSELADRVITEAYIGRFTQEMKTLGGAQMAVELVRSRTERGHAYYQVRLKEARPGTKVSQVLSEGQFRIVSLAAFLADMEGTEDQAPFVFDDPISSLDQDFEEATVNRLLSLSQKRQVIVFTHRLSLLVLLEEKAKAQGVNAHRICLSEERWGAGEPQDPPLQFRTPDNALNALLGEWLPRARKELLAAGRDKYEILAKALCSEIRILLERFIENDLLADVVKRFRRAINTQGKLKYVARVTPEDCELFDGLMTQYSRYEHSQPDELPIKLPEPEEIEEDLRRLKAWYDEFKSRK